MIWWRLIIYYVSRLRLLKLGYCIWVKKLDGFFFYGSLRIMVVFLKFLLKNIIKNCACRFRFYLIIIDNIINLNINFCYVI